jgi:hypothetical protein
MSRELSGPEPVPDAAGVVAPEPKKGYGMIPLGSLAGVLVGAAVSMIVSRHFPFLGALPGLIIGFMLGLIAELLYTENPRPGLRSTLCTIIVLLLLIGLVLGGLVCVGNLLFGAIEHASTPIGDGVIRD